MVEFLGSSGGGGLLFTRFPRDINRFDTAVLRTFGVLAVSDMTSAIHMSFLWHDSTVFWAREYLEVALLVVPIFVCNASKVGLGRLDLGSCLDNCSNFIILFRWDGA